MSKIQHDIINEVSTYDGNTITTRTADGRTFVGKGRTRPAAIHNAHQQAQRVNRSYDYPMADWERKAKARMIAKGITR